MILPLQDLIDITGLSHSVALELTHQGVEKEIKNYCEWEIESATYTNILVDGTGSDWIWPGHKNITALTRAATGKRTAINIKHSTASSNTYAKVTYTDLTPTSLGLVVIDGTDVNDTTDLFSTYSTMTLLVAQINANAGNWSAELFDTDFGIFGSTNLLEVDNLVSGTEDGTDPGWSELQMPGAAIGGVRVERVEGGLYRPSGWPSGIQNIPLTYVAGWTTANMPADLRQAVVLLSQFFYKKHQSETTGIKSFSLKNLEIEYVTETANGVNSAIPIEVLEVLDTYRIKGIV